MGQGTSPFQDPLWYGERANGVENITIGSGGVATVVKAGPGVLSRIYITLAGTTGNLSLYDAPSFNALGPGQLPLMVVPGASNNGLYVVGYALNASLPFMTGLVAVGASNSPQVTASFL